MPPGSPTSRYIGGEVAFDKDGIKWVLARIPPVPRNYPGNEYIIAQAGDTLQGLSFRKYGQMRFWDILADENDIIDPTQRLTGGQVVIGPPDGQIQSEVLGRRSTSGRS